MAVFKARLGFFFIIALVVAPAYGGPAAFGVARPIIIDAGHGGADMGAVSAGEQEKNITLAVARRLKTELETLGLGPIEMTRDSDEFIPLNRRTDETSAWNGSLFISLHANKVPAKNLHGVTLYAFGKGQSRSDQHHRHHRKIPPLPAPPTAQIRAGALLARDLARGLRHCGVRVESVERADYYVLKNPRTPSVLVELGFLSNPEEAKLLADPAYQEKLAESLAAGLANHLAHRVPTSAPALAKTR